MRNGYNLTKTEQAKAWKVLLWIFGVLLVIGGLALNNWGGRQVSAESASWETVIAARLVLFKVLVAVPAAMASLLGAWFLFGALDRSSLGARLFHWGAEEPPHVKAAKTKNAGLTLAALILGLLTLLAGALR